MDTTAFFELIEGTDHSNKNPIFTSTKIHIARALEPRITYNAQLKLEFVERLRQSNNDHKR